MKTILKSTVKLIRKGRRAVMEPLGRGFAEVIDSVMGLSTKDYTLRVRYTVNVPGSYDVQIRYYHVCSEETGKEYVLREENLPDEVNPWAGQS